nr:S49 family peptidase [Pedobacter sp. ASV19]
MINQALLSEIFNQPWSIESSYVQALVLSYYTAFKSGNRPESAVKMASPYAVLQSDGSRQEKDIQPGSIGVITIDGPIVKNSDYWYGIKGTLDAAAEFQAFDANPNIIGIILALNSGGGAVYAIKPLTDVLSQRTKPLVILSQEYLCSAAMRIAAHGDSRIMYHPQGIVGSIGTMYSNSNLQPMLEKWGMEFHEVYATLSTLKNKTFTEVLKGKYELLKERMLDPMNEDFIAEMKSLMGHLIDSKTPGIWAGETYLGTEAVKLGLISAIGNFSDAIQEVIQHSNTSNSPITNTINMKFEKLTALAGNTEPSQEALDLANAELTAAGVTGATLVADSLITEAESVTKERDALKATNLELSNSLATANTSLTNVQAENISLKEKIAKGPAAVAPVVESKDPVVEKSALEQSNETIASFSHNRGIANNPLFIK